MIIEKQKVVTLTYEMYVKEENGSEELMERTTTEQPLTYCHGEGMMLPAFEKALEGKTKGERFDFTLPYAEAYGEYDEQGVMELDKKLFCDGDGEFDNERVYVGNIIPMNTVDGQIVKAMVIDITQDKVTIDLNHPLAGEDLHFVGTIVDIREASEKELEAIRHPHHCGKCKGHCDSDCNRECNGECHCGEATKH